MVIFSCVTLKPFCYINVSSCFVYCCGMHTGKYDFCGCIFGMVFFLDLLRPILRRLCIVPQVNRLQALLKIFGSVGRKLTAVWKSHELESQYQQCKVTRSADKGVVGWNTIFQFSGSDGRAHIGPSSLHLLEVYWIPFAERIQTTYNLKQRL